MLTGMGTKKRRASAKGTRPLDDHPGYEPTRVAPPGTMGYELDQLRRRLDLRRGAVAKLLGLHPPATTYYEGGDRRPTEEIVRAYGSLGGLFPLIGWTQVTPGAKIPHANQPIPVADSGGLPREKIGPPGSWARALNDLREANELLRADMATYLKLTPSRITQLEGGDDDSHDESRLGYLEQYGERFGVRWTLTWIAVAEAKRRGIDVEPVPIRGPKKKAKKPEAKRPKRGAGKT